MNTIDKVKQWFIDCDLENGGRLDKQSLKLSEEFGELCAGYLKKNEKLTKDSIGDCAVVIVGLALLVKTDVHKIFEESCFVKTGDLFPGGANGITLLITRSADVFFNVKLPYTLDPRQ